MIGRRPAINAVANNEITPEYGDPGSCRGPNTLKYRIVTVSKPYNSVNIWQYCSATSFCRAYGDSGLAAMSSRLGSVGVSPYADDEPAYTSRLTPASRAATSTFSDAVMFERFDVIGSLMERGTDGMAAWCST